jgi:hypothetical protein
VAATAGEGCRYPSNSPRRSVTLWGTSDVAAHRRGAGRQGHTMKLYGYYRSSAAYRVRIALNLKGLDYEQ